MRLETKPAAALCAASFTLLLIFGAAWPGPGLWLLAAALIFLAGGAGAWWLDAAPARSGGGAQRVAHTPFAAAPARPAPAGGGARPQLITPEGVHLALISAAIGLLALILFISGALGGDDQTAVPSAVELETNPRVIDLSRENDPTALPTPAAGQTSGQLTGQTAATAQPIATSTPAATAAPPAAAAQPRPIVVADPEPATPVQATPRSADTAAATPPARTVQHTVVEGDSLYGIALEYNTTVDAIEALNDITSATVIHPGDVLLIPQPDE